MPSTSLDVNLAQTPAQIDRPMPQNLEAEAALLSAMIWNQEALQECLIELVPEEAGSFEPICFLDAGREYLRRLAQHHKAVDQERKEKDVR